MKKKLLVSILIPAYNEEEHIASCVNSLLHQNYKHVEVFVTDDGSKDKTLEIVRRIARKNMNVHVLTQLHQGPEEAWRKMSKYSKGEIIMMFGADMTAGETVVEDLARPLIEKKAQGTSPRVEFIKNAEWSIWARARGRVRVTHPHAILVTTREIWNKYWTPDKRAGYTSDQTIYFNSGIKPLMVDTYLYHNNPATFKECWQQFVWIGAASKKKHLLLMGFLVFPISAIAKSIRQFISDPYLPFVVFLPFYHSMKYIGYFVGIIKKAVTGRNVK